MASYLEPTATSAAPGDGGARGRSGERRRGQVSKRECLKLATAMPYCLWYVLVYHLPQCPLRYPRRRKSAAPPLRHQASVTVPRHFPAQPLRWRLYEREGCYHHLPRGVSCVLICVSVGVQMTNEGLFEFVAVGKHAHHTTHSSLGTDHDWTTVCAMCYIAI